MKRPAFWLALAALSIVATVVGVRYFPQAFSIVSLDITMDRDAALARARGIMKPSGRGVFLINRLMDDVAYVDGGREIQMKKRRAPTPTP